MFFLRVIRIKVSYRIDKLVRVHGLLSADWLLVEVVGGSEQVCPGSLELFCSWEKQILRCRELCALLGILGT